MKRTRSFIALVLIFASASANAFASTTYQCQEGGCTSTFVQHENGFGWLVSCEDGSWAGGFTSGAVYAGHCPMIAE